MALVNYSSDSNSSCAGDPPCKSARDKRTRQREVHSSKIMGDSCGSLPPHKRRKALPPLPDAFHDLYAHSVRTSNVDDPELHQGRRRLVPHKPGNWPSHLYIEWHPTPGQYNTLSNLLTSIQEKVPQHVTVVPLLKSDLGAPLPLHVSLSRPLSLTSSNKDSFLESVQTSIERCGVSSFAVSVTSPQWHHAEESGRTFIVLQVQSSIRKGQGKNNATNAELVTLLSKCNAIAKRYGQLPLYYSSRDKKKIDSAFHVSIGWTKSSSVTDEMQTKGTEAFASFPDLLEMRIQVESIKAKIGNAVTSLPLVSGKAGTADSAGSSGLLRLF